MKPQTRKDKIIGILAAIWGIGSFLFILLGFLFALAFLMLTPLAMIFLALTLIGVPLAIFTIGGYILVIYTAKIFPALLIGTMITKRPATAFWSAAGAGTLGLVIYYVLSSVPILGPIVTFLVICFGSGAQLLLLSQVYQDNRKKYGV